MSDPSHEIIVSLVNSMFEVNQFNRGIYSLEFRILDSDFKSKFENLARKLENMNYFCRLVEINGERFLIIEKFTQKKQIKWLNASWIPRILFAIVIIFVMVDGYYKTLE